jgi:hypothetical protein
VLPPRFAEPAARCPRGRTPGLHELSGLLHLCEGVIVRHCSLGQRAEH